MIIDETKIVIGLIGFVSAIFWYWLKSRDKRMDKQDESIAQIKQDYVRRDDAHRDFTLVMTLLEEIKQQVQNINDKIDRKADK